VAVDLESLEELLKLPITFIAIGVYVVSKEGRGESEISSRALA